MRMRKIEIEEDKSETLNVCCCKVIKIHQFIWKCFILNLAEHPVVIDLDQYLLNGVPAPPCERFRDPVWTF